MRFAYASIRTDEVHALYWDGTDANEAIEFFQDAAHQDAYNLTQYSINSDGQLLDDRYKFLPPNVIPTPIWIVYWKDYISGPTIGVFTEGDFHKYFSLSQDYVLD
jgi:hypothetical protein